MTNPVRIRQLVSALLVCFSLATLPTISAAADAPVDTAAAQALFDQGRQFMAQGNYVEACPKLEESARIVAHSGTLLNLADCYEKTGRITSAWSTFLSAAAAAKRTSNTEREAEARSRANALAPVLPKIVINAVTAEKNAGVVIARDGTTVGQAQFGVPIPADPGEHTVTASMPGRKSWQTKIVVKGKGELVKVDVPVLEAQPSVAPQSEAPRPPSAGRASESPPQSRRTLALVVGGVGVAGVALGSVAGLVSMSKHNQANEHCVGSSCADMQGVDLRSGARTWGNVSTVGFIVGAVGIAAGTTLWLSSPKAESTRTAQIGVGPGSLVFKGQW